MGRPGKGLATYLSLREKFTNKKQKAKFANNDITNEDFRDFIKKFEIYLI